MIRRTKRTRSGFALIDVIVGGVILGIGLGVAVTVATRAMQSQSQAEHQLVASWLADELLSLVVIEGPVDYPKVYNTAGDFEEPFEQYSYDVDIDDIGLGEPFRVTATVYWSGLRSNTVQAQTLIAQRVGEDEHEQRAPAEPIDRDLRYYGDDNESY